jgi:hypothetical protein
MGKISTFRLALWSGVIAEVIACGSVIHYLGYGSDTPSPSWIAAHFYVFIVMFHMPVFWLARHFMPIIGIIGLLIFAILSGMTQFAILFWVVISLWRRLHGNNSPASRPVAKLISN